MDYKEKEAKLFSEVQRLKDGNQESYNEVYALSADYVYKLIYDLTQDVNDANEIINQVYSDIYYGISGLLSPEYFYAWAGKIATTNTVKYMKQLGRFEIPDSGMLGGVGMNGNSVTGDAGNGTAGGNGNTVAIDGTADKYGSVGANGQMFAYNYDSVTEYYSEDDEKFIPDSILTDTEKQRVITEYIENLTPFAKAVVQCYFYEAMSVSDISEALECDKTEVKKTLHEGKLRLKVLLGTENENFAEAGVLLYDMTSLPIIWLIFHSALNNVPVSALVAGTAAAGGTGIGSAEAGGGAASGTAIGSGTTLAGNAAVGSGVAGNMLEGTGASVGTGMAGGGAIAAGTGMATGIKVAIAVAATALIGGGALAVSKLNTSSEGNSTEYSAEKLNDESVAAYQEFVAGERTAVVRDGFELGYVYDEDAGVTEGEIVSIEDIENKMIKSGSNQGLDLEYDYGYYRYIDLGADGVFEAVVYMSFEEYSGIEDVQIVLKYMDGELYVIFYGCESTAPGGDGVDVPYGIIHQRGLTDPETNKIPGDSITSYTKVSIYDKDANPHEICQRIYYLKDANYYDMPYEDALNELDEYIREDDDLITEWVIDGNVYYTIGCTYDRDHDYFFDDFLEMCDENGITITSEEEVEELIEEKEQEYLVDIDASNEKKAELGLDKSYDLILE